MTKTETIKQCPYCKMVIAPLDRHAQQMIPDRTNPLMVNVVCMLQRYYQIIAERPTDPILGMTR